MLVVLDLAITRMGVWGTGVGDIAVWLLVVMVVMVVMVVGCRLLLAP
jgi:hypothetical protein